MIFLYYAWCVLVLLWVIDTGWPRCHREDGAKAIVVEKMTNASTGTDGVGQSSRELMATVRVIKSPINQTRPTTPASLITPCLRGMLMSVQIMCVRAFYGRGRSYLLRFRALTHFNYFE